MSFVNFFRSNKTITRDGDADGARERGGISSFFGRQAANLRKVAAVALIAVAGLAGTADDAAAQVNCGTEVGAGTGSGYATGGTGAFRDSIFWLDWSCGATTSFPATSTVTKSWSLSNGLAVTATIAPRNVAIRPYTTGLWQGDILDDLYSGVNPIGLSNSGDGQDPVYTISFSTTVGG